MSEKLIITPKTKVMQLIEDYPQLEEILISYVPEFKKLKNPILRKTVARIATLQQAASIGNVKIEDLINILRKEVGQDIFSENAGSVYTTEKPEWFAGDLIKAELDVRAMLTANEHPVSQVMSDLKDLPAGSIYKLIAPFLPAPLIDKALSLDVKHWVVKENEGLYLVYFFKP